MTNPVDRWSEGQEGLMLDGAPWGGSPWRTTAQAIRELIQAARANTPDPDLPEGVERLRDGTLIASGTTCRTLRGGWEVLDSWWTDAGSCRWTGNAYWQVRRKETTELVPWHEAWGRTLPDGEPVRSVYRSIGDGYWVNSSRSYVNQDTGMVEVRK